MSYERYSTELIAGQWDVSLYAFYTNTRHDRKSSVKMFTFVMVTSMHCMQHTTHCLGLTQRGVRICLLYTELAPLPQSALN